MQRMMVVAAAMVGFVWCLVGGGVTAGAAAVVATTATASSTDDAGLPTRTNEFKLKDAAVLSLATSFPNSDGPALLLTSFGVGSDTDGVFVVRSIREALTAPANVSVEPIDTSVPWPNQVDMAPLGAVAGVGSLVLSSGGFFVSGSKSTGDVTLHDVTGWPSKVSHVKVSTDKKGNFYHHAEWHDVDGDGRLDLLAARAYKSMLNPFSKAQGELLWLEPPRTGESLMSGGNWTEHVLTTVEGLGPDVAFTAVMLDGTDGGLQVVAAQFFTAQQLSIWWCDKGLLWSACKGGEGVQSVVIDNEAPYFNVQWVDLNGDGTKELLATTNEANGKGAVFVFEQPDSWKDGVWKKHRIATGYTPKQAFLPGRGSPGTAIAFPKHAGDKELHIVVSADDGGWVDLLSPIPGVNFGYTQERMCNSTNTIGTPAVGDVDGDGTVEIFVPLYAESKVAVYRFQ